MTAQCSVLSAHLNQGLSSCSSSTYALRVLRRHDLQPQLSQEVAKMTTIASLMYMYASPVGGASLLPMTAFE